MIRKIIKIDEEKCNGCGLCEKKCPYHIDVKSVHSGKVCHVDCTLCGECVAACSTNALNIGFCKPRKSRVWKIVPAVLTAGLIAFGMWAGGKFELPTIDMKWGIEVMGPDSTMVKVVDEMYSHVDEFAYTEKCTDRLHVRTDPYDGFD